MSRDSHGTSSVRQCSCLSARDLSTSVVPTMRKAEKLKLYSLHEDPVLHISQKYSRVSKYILSNQCSVLLNYIIS